MVTEFGALQQALEEQVMQKLGMTLVEGSLQATVSAAPGSPLAAVQDSCSCDTATSHREYVLLVDGLPLRSLNTLLSVQIHGLRLPSYW